MSQNRVVVQLGEVTNTCFVMMPFQPLFDKEYDSVIKPAVEGSGLKCVRGNEIYTQQAILNDIWASIRTSRLVIAELSGRNPNVMYEVGLAHAIGKPIILLTRNQDDVPFDLMALRYFFYDTNNPVWGPDLRTELSKAIARVLENPLMGAHLPEIKIESPMPVAPVGPITKTSITTRLPDLDGVWRGEWASKDGKIMYKATLVIPAEHGVAFTASMTIVFAKDRQETIIEETLTAKVDAHGIMLAGVSYTYVRQGKSSGYRLDSFDLQVAEDKKTMTGKVLRANGGNGEIVLRRVAIRERA